MPSLQKDARLFGLDLAPLGRDILTAWRGMLDWPVLVWLWPRPRLSLWLPDGTQALSRGPLTTAVPIAKTQSKSGKASATSAPHQARDQARALARFQALVLPEDILLRRSLVMPALAQAELQAALALQLHAFSPFPLEDLVWTSEVQLAEDGKTQHIHAALSSRKLIAQHLATLPTAATLGDIEVWVPHVKDGHHAVASGFAENQRHRRSAAWRWVSASLVMLALALLVGIAATPSVQLYLRSKQAEAALQALQQKALPVLAERERFTLVTEKLTQLGDNFNQSVAPRPVLQLITEALGDDTSLLSLQVQGHKVSLTGQTVNASALMKKLDSLSGLREVRAPAPATKPLGATRESFTIEFTMDPAQWPTVSPDAMTQASPAATLSTSALAPASVPTPAATPAAAKTNAPPPAATPAPPTNPSASPPANPAAAPANSLVVPNKAQSVPVNPRKTP
jgi:general secretion pathway protein L